MSSFQDLKYFVQNIILIVNVNEILKILKRRHIVSYLLFELFYGFSFIYKPWKTNSNVNVYYYYFMIFFV